MKPHFCAEVWNWALILGFFFFPDILQFFVCPYIIVPILACCPFPIWTDSSQYDNRYSYSSHRWLIWLSRHRIFFRVPVSIRCVVYWLSNHRFIDIKRCRSRTADTTITQSTFFIPRVFFNLSIFIFPLYLATPILCFWSAEKLQVAQLQVKEKVARSVHLEVSIVRGYPQACWMVYLCLFHGKSENQRMITGVPPWLRKPPFIIWDEMNLWF